MEGLGPEMALLRAFIACELSTALQDAIQRTIASLQEGLPPKLVRWVPAHNVHLTLKFLGDVAPSSLESIQSVLAAEAARHLPFEIAVEGFGVFPNSRHPRVLWIGLKVPAELTALQRELDVATAKLGYKSELRDFSPHLTVGRVREAVAAADLQRMRDELVHTHVGLLGSERVTAVHLLRSDLQPSGAVYTKLFTAPLGRAADDE